jgi:hypothetical protein
MQLSTAVQDVLDDKLGKNRIQFWPITGQGQRVRESSVDGSE